MKTIKIIFNFGLLMILTLLLWACHEYDQPYIFSSDYVSVTKDATIEPTGATNDNPVKINVTASGDWTASADKSWLSINPSNGNKNTNTISLTAGENNSGEEREAKITVKCGTKSDTCTVKQKAIANISVNPSTLDFGAVGETKTIRLTANVGWYVKENPKWCQLSPMEGGANVKVIEIEVTAEDNTTTTPHENDKIIFSDNNNHKAEVTVTQKAGERPTISKFQRDEKSGIFTFSYSSIFPISEVGICYSPDKDVPESTDNPIKYSFTDEYNGTAEISIPNPPAKSYHVRAFAKNAVGVGYYNEPIKVEPEKLDIKDSEGKSIKDSVINRNFNEDTYTFRVVGNVKWEASLSNKDMCTLSPTKSDAPETYVEVTILANPDTKPRECTIKINGINLRPSFTIKQEAGGATPGHDDNPQPATVRKKTKKR